MGLESGVRPTNWCAATNRRTVPAPTSMSGILLTPMTRARRAATSRRWVLLVAVVGVLAAGGAAQARRTDLDPDTEIARRHFAVGVAAYNAGSYAAALKEFEAAYEVKPLPAFEFNIARCLDRLERFEQALLAYRRFVAHTSNRGEGEEAHRRIKVLEERLARRAPPEPLPAPSPVPVPDPALGPEPPGPAPVGSRIRRNPGAPPEAVTPAPPAEAARGVEPRRKGWYIAPTVVAVAAVASLGAGLGLYLSARSDHDALAASCGTSCDPASYQGPQQRADISYGLLGLGFALVAADAVLWLVLAQPPQRSLSPSVALVPGPGNLSVVGRF